MTLDPATLTALAGSPWTWGLTVIFCLGGWRVLVALRRDWGRTRPLDEIDVTDRVRKAASQEVARVEARMAEIERRLDEVLAELEAEQRGRARERRRADEAEARVDGLLAYVAVVLAWIADRMPDHDGVPPLPPWLRPTP